MGMFDSVSVNCPKCGKSLEIQSKAGDCLLNGYSLDNCPPEILLDINNEVQYCSCGLKFSIKVEMSPKAYIAIL